MTRTSISKQSTYDFWFQTEIKRTDNLVYLSYKQTEKTNNPSGTQFLSNCSGIMILISYSPWLIQFSAQWFGPPNNFPTSVSYQNTTIKSLQTKSTNPMLLSVSTYIIILNLTSPFFISTSRKSMSLLSLKLTSSAMKVAFTCIWLFIGWIKGEVTFWAIISSL